MGNRDLALRYPAHDTVTSDVLPSKSIGRPRDQSVDRAILAATREMLIEVGYSNLALERVAARAGVGRTSLYRRWSSKGPLVWEAVFGTVESLPMPDTGDLEEDLRIVNRWAVAQCTTPEAMAALPGMMADISTNEELGQIIRERLFQPHYARVAGVLERGVERGQLRADVDLELLMDTFIAVLLTRATALHRPLDDAVVDKLVDLILMGGRPREQKSRARSTGKDR